MTPEQKPKNLRIIIFTLVAVVIFGAAFFVARFEQKPPAIPAENLSGIQVIEQGDQKIVRNIAEGYQITVPKEWDPQIIDRGEAGKNLRFNDGKIKEPTTSSEISSGCISDIFVNKNPQNLTLDKWINLYAPGGIVSKKEIKIANNINAIEITGNELGPYIVVYASNPENNDIHEIILYPNEPDANSCIDNFNKVLDTYLF